MKNKFLMLSSAVALLFSTSLPAKTHEVKIFKRKFIPAEITVNQGDTIIWKNVEKRQYHNVWFQSLVKEEPDVFFPGESYTRKFDDLGDFNYICGPHPKMQGVVKVVGKDVKIEPAKGS